jgi:hypothetical protein
MTTTPQAIAAADAPPAPDAVPRRRGFVTGIIRSQPQAVVGLVILALFALVAIFANVLEPHSHSDKTGGMASTCCRS